MKIKFKIIDAYTVKRLKDNKILFIITAAITLAAYLLSFLIW